jgi:site-specific DNA recombinase
VEQFTETHSGLKLQRPQLDALRDMVDRGEVDIVLAYDTDRLSRDPDHLSYLAKYFLDAGVQLEFVRMPTENTDEGRLLMYVQGYSSKKKITKFVDRSRRGKRAKALKSDHNYGGGFVPYGYTTEKYLDGDRFKNRIIIDPIQADTVKEVFSLYNGGNTTSQIAKLLHESHVPTKRKGGTWTGSLVWRMLRNKVYIGKGHHADVESPRPAIIDEVTFTQAQLRLNKNTHRAGRPANVLFIY